QVGPHRDRRQPSHRERRLHPAVSGRGAARKLESDCVCCHRVRVASHRTLLRGSGQPVRRHWRTLSLHPRCLWSVVGFEVGWMWWFTRVAAQASVVNALALAVGFYWADMTAGMGRAALIVCVTLTIGWINLRGLRQSCLAINLITFAKLLPLALFILVGIWFV